MDVAVAYGKYGMDVIRKRAPKAKLQYIYHGVDSKNFHPLTDDEKREARKQLIGGQEDKLIIGIVARNQPRKAFDKLFEAYFYILGGHYVTCNSCKKITVSPFDLLTRALSTPDRCKHCFSTDVVKGVPRDDVRVYIHGALVDCGWDLLDLQTDFNLHGKILVNPALKIGAGVSEFVLNGVYNCFDIFTLPTRGEGFGLPIIEAMSCGLPVVVTDYSAHPEWVRGCGELVPPAVLESEPLTNIRRAIIDMDLYVTSLVKLLNDAELRKAYGKLAREKAISMDWGGICKQWEQLIDGVLYPDGNAPKIVSPSEMKYTLEAM
jgi:glycosyltransferase involved in cell wall biosynthesis